MKPSAILLTILTLFASCAVHGNAQQPAIVEATCQSLLVPTYLYPARGGSDWSAAIADASWSRKVTRTLIMNPNSGPGNEANSDYAAIAQTVKAAGGGTVGYVWTDYGAEPLASVEKQVDSYIQWYGVAGLNGIFLDGTSADAARVDSYYQPLLTYITTKLPHAKVVFNAGTYPAERYARMKTATPDSSFQLIVFEDDFDHFSKPASDEPAWIAQYSASMFIDIVYKTRREELGDALRLSVKRHAGAVYITDELYPNPYKKLPSYWRELVAATQKGCS